MHPPDDPLAPLPGAEILFRVLPPKPVSAHVVHSEQKQMEFRLLFPRGTLAEMGDGGVYGINSVDLYVGRGHLYSLDANYAI